MSGWVLTYRSRSGPALVDGSLLRPDTLGPLDEAALAATLLPVGRTRVPLGELFIAQRTDAPRAEHRPERAAPSDATGCGDASAIEQRQPFGMVIQPVLILRNTPPLDHLGAQMTAGELTIEGDAGDDLGASMSGGLIRVTGCAGHRVGGPHPTSKRGMTGGEIIIDGACGDYAGFLMRRGLIAVAGPCGRSPGYRMLAGTLALGQGPVDHPGLEMQRGTIICTREDAAVRWGPNFREGGAVEAGALPAIAVVMRRLRALGWPRDLPSSRPPLPAKWRLWTGDALELNKGEVLQWLS
jgi:hypothetical protein